MQLGYIEINGKRLECARFMPKRGASSKVTILLLHEGLGCVSMWRDFPERLAEATGLEVFAYSRAGYGASDPCEVPRPLDYMEEAGLNEVPEVIKRAGIGEHILLGHSDGGTISLVYAGGTEAGGLLGVVTFAAHLFAEEEGLSSIRQARGNYLFGDLKEGLRKYHGENVDCAFWGWNLAWLHPDFKEWNVERFLQGVTVPLLAVQGYNDEYGTLAQIEAIINGAPVEVETLLLPECGHSPHKEKQEETLAAIQKFILGL
ncbi:MAG: alpha/beta hydrolase [Deltaproteobacteria bacterium]|nr:MAG: alpha/beta hydrolase [Deltaproteobacteria bacterium]